MPSAVPRTDLDHEAAVVRLWIATYTHTEHGDEAYPDTWGGRARVGGCSMTDKIWGLVLPDDMIPAARTLNTRDSHWAQRHAWNDQVRTSAGWMAKAGLANGQTPPPSPVHVTCTRWVTDRRRRDCDNLAASFKPMIDGLVDAGALEDDSWPDHVVGVTYLIARGPVGLWEIELRGVDAV